MSIETDLYTTLTTTAGVTDICSTRIYPNPAPQSAARPYVSYQVVSETRINTLPGVGDAIRKRIQINCNADTYSAAKGLAAAVIAALEGGGYLEFSYDGYDYSTQVHTVYVDWSFMAV